MSGRHSTAVAMIAVVLAIGEAVAFLYLLSRHDAAVHTLDRTVHRVDVNTRLIAQGEKTQIEHDAIDRTMERETNYRICARQMEVRAAIVVHVALGHRDQGEATEAELVHALPIYDCSPDLKGLPAKKLSDSQARAYLRAFDHKGALAPP